MARPSNRFEVSSDQAVVNAASAYHLMKLGGPWTDHEVDAEGTVVAIRERTTGRVVAVEHTGAGAYGEGGRLVPGPAWDYTDAGRAIGERLRQHR